MEGQGEVQALPVVLRRIVEAIEPGRWIEARRPMRVNRGSLLKEGEFERYVELAARQHGGLGATLILVDADDDCAAKVGPALYARARKQRPDCPVAVVLAVREFEAWFLASAHSLAGKRGLPADLSTPPDPETIRDAKGWLQARRTDDLAYAPTVDQPALAATFDLNAARTCSASFDKLWRDVERLLRETGT